MLDPEEILNIWLNAKSDHNDIVEAMKDYGRRVRKTTLEWAANNVKLKILDNTAIIADRESILSGESHPDLNI